MYLQSIALALVAMTSALRWDLHLEDGTGHEIPVHMVAPDDIKEEVPLMLFMHGDPCMWWWYEYIANYVVPNGYVVGLMASYEPTGEPKNMAFDMRYALDAIVYQSKQNATFPLYQKLSQRAAAVGHSAGSNAALMSVSSKFANFSNKFAAVASFAPFETPSLKEYLHDIQSPLPSVFMLSGTSDCMCPPKGSVPIYEQLLSASVCKFYGMVVNGSHCHFADIYELDNTCYHVEEATCPSSEKNRTIVPRQTQLNVTKTLLLQFLDASLKDASGSAKQQQDFDDLTASMNTLRNRNILTNISSSCKVQ
eukprot:TRINITY_DN16508_c0_g1_i1.p1 TRINITY_DN16508_c0_g1~~TRINITY_DN16508_c0_g1_i1.p1  ORF type:complete len:322 (+),score=59.93 TRINITY_DN16508_c0_g1_i1:45-968(+)